MKVLLINGSPHEHGCTDRALQEVAAGLTEYNVQGEIVWLGGEAIPACRGCRACRKEAAGRCIGWPEDIVNRMIDKMEECDALVLGSPVHYAAASGQITSFAGRMFFASGTKMAYKPGASVAVARRAGCTSTFDQLNKYFTISNMPLASSRYWNLGFGPTADDLQQDEEGLNVLRLLGSNLAWLLHSIEAGRAAGITPPAAK